MGLLPGISLGRCIWRIWLNNMMDYGQLKELQELDLEHKLIITKGRILEWCEYWEWLIYVSFSGGKDSTVLLDLVCQVWAESRYIHGNSELQVVFVDTGLEYPEIRKFVDLFIPYLAKKYDIKINLAKLKPKMTFKQVLVKYGYPVISKRQAQYIREIQNVTGKNEATIKLRLTGIRSSGKYSGYSKISKKKWSYLKDAPFKISEKCCSVMKKHPMDDYVKKTGRLPFVGTMAADGAG